MSYKLVTINDMLIISVVTRSIDGTSLAKLQIAYRGNDIDKKMQGL